MSARTKRLNGTVICERSATGPGPALWSPIGTDDDRQYLWPGQGAGLFFVDAEGITPVTHQAASGHYSELKQARGALARLLAERPASPRQARRQGSRRKRRPAPAAGCAATRQAPPDRNLLMSQRSC